MVFGVLCDSNHGFSSLSGFSPPRAAAFPEFGSSPGQPQDTKCGIRNQPGGMTAQKLCQIPKILGLRFPGEATELVSILLKYLHLASIDGED